MSLNVNKTEIGVSRSPTKQIYKNLNFRLSEKKIEPKHCTKYLGVIFDEHLSFNEYMNTIKHDFLLHQLHYTTIKANCFWILSDFTEIVL